MSCRPDDAPARMRPSTAQIQAPQRRPILRPTWDGSEGEKLVRGQVAVKDVPTRQTKFSLQILRRKGLQMNDALRKVRRKLVHDRKDALDKLVLPLFPPANGLVRRILNKQRDDVFTVGR